MSVDSVEGPSSAMSDTRLRAGMNGDECGEESAAPDVEARHIGDPSRSGKLADSRSAKPRAPSWLVPPPTVSSSPSSPLLLLSDDLN